MRGRSEVQKIIYNKGSNIQKRIEYWLDTYFDCFLLSLTGLNLKDKYFLFKNNIRAITIKSNQFREKLHIFLSKTVYLQKLFHYH